MLSNEENKMLEIFKKEVEKEQNVYEQVNEYTKFYYNNHKFILNLIKKQSKEIEELKKPKYVINCKTNEITKLTNDFVSKDKIKAKIEELRYYVNNPKEAKYYAAWYLRKIDTLEELLTGKLLEDK